MRRLGRILLLGLAIGVLANVAARAATSAQDGLPACVRVEGVARYGSMGYDHYVRVTNGCDRRARCQVSTNVNPQAISVVVDPGATREVITFRGSPARELTPQVTCALE